MGAATYPLSSLRCNLAGGSDPPGSCLSGPAISLPGACIAVEGRTTSFGIVLTDTEEPSSFGKWGAERRPCDPLTHSVILLSELPLHADVSPCGPFRHYQPIRRVRLPDARRRRTTLASWQPWRACVKSNHGSRVAPTWRSAFLAVAAGPYSIVCCLPPTSGGFQGERIPTGSGRTMDRNAGADPGGTRPQAHRPLSPSSSR